jgi:putative ABC transport system permease protein
VGVPLALASARVLKSLLYGVEPTDGFTLLLTVATFLAAGVLASLLPVRKATRIEPIQALRYE